MTLRSDEPSPAKQTIRARLYFLEPGRESVVVNDVDAAATVLVLELSPHNREFKPTGQIDADGCVAFLEVPDRSSQ